MKVVQLCLTLCDPMDYTVYGILQARILEWVAFPFSRGSSQPRDQTQVSCIAGGFFTSWATRETLLFSSVAQSYPTLCDPMNCSTPGLPVHHQLLEFTQTHVHWVGNAIQPSHPLLSPSPPTPSPSSIRVFSSESILRMRWPKYLSFSFSISPSNEHPGLISFRMDWLDLLAVQGTLKGLLQHHSSKASIFQCSAFFTVQLSHPYMTTGKTITLTRRTFVSNVMCLLFNMLSRLVIAFLPRSKGLLISWLQSPSAVILEPKKIKFLTVSIVSPSICHEVMGLDAMILVFWMLSFKPTFSLFSFTLIKRPFCSSSLSAIMVVSSVYLRLFIFLLAILISQGYSIGHKYCQNLDSSRIWNLGISQNQDSGGVHGNNVLLL